MKRFLLVVVVGAALLSLFGAQAQAKPSHTQHCVVSKAFVLKGTFESGNATAVTFDVTRGNRHARRAGFEGDDTNGDNDKFTADPTRGPVRFSGYETGEPPEVGDKVRVVGKIIFNRCTDTYGAVTIRRAKVIDGDN